MLIGNDGGVGYSSDGGNLEPRNNMFHTAQYYTVAVAPVGMFDNYATKVYGNDPLQGSWDQSANNGDGNYVQKMETIINGHTDVFAGGMQDNGTSIQADNDNGFSLGNDFSGGDGAATMFSQNPDNKYFIQNYVYNNDVRAVNLNGTNSREFDLLNEGGSNGDFITTQTLDSNQGVVFSNYGDNRICLLYTSPSPRDRG